MVRLLGSGPSPATNLVSGVGELGRKVLAWLNEGSTVQLVQETLAQEREPHFHQL